MLYQFVDFQRALLAPWTAWGVSAASALIDPDSPLALVPGVPCLAAGYEMLCQLGKTCVPAGFGSSAVRHDGRVIPVIEQVVLERPFCRLLRFRPNPATPCADGEARPRPPVLVCAPLAGHRAIMLREVVQALLPEHEVYVTDWTDARRVPVAQGPFYLDDCVALLQACIRGIGAQSLHVLAICQATAPALAAVSLLASAGEPTPKSLILMGGPIDARRSPTAIGHLAARHPLSWFQRHLVNVVPQPYPGAGRMVCPSFLQFAGLMAAQPAHLVAAYWDYYLDLVRGDVESAETQRRACEAFHAVLDMAAEFYLDTIHVVFHEFQLARGGWRVHGEAVRPQDIGATALLTIEGERDAISGCGQTQAAHDLCRGLTAGDKRHVTVRWCDHYDLFCGPKLAHRGPPLHPCADPPRYRSGIGAQQALAHTALPTTWRTTNAPHAAHT